MRNPTKGSIGSLENGGHFQQGLSAIRRVLPPSSPVSGVSWRFGVRRRHKRFQTLSFEHLI
jgi:hypothetical protein